MPAPNEHDETPSAPPAPPDPKPAVRPPAPERGRYEPKRPPDPRSDRTFSRSSRHRGQWNKKNKG
jgi:hypothetical protein